MEKITATEATCMMKALLASLSQSFFETACASLEALKKEIVAMSEETKARITKKYPICPGNKCSPSNFISSVCFLENYFTAVCSVMVFSSCFLSSLYLLGHFNKISLHSK